MEYNGSYFIDLGFEISFFFRGIKYIIGKDIGILKMNLGEESREI